LICEHQQPIKPERYVCKLAEKHGHHVVVSASFCSKCHPQLCGDELTPKLVEITSGKQEINRSPRGLGDTIASITHATGIAQAVEYVSGKLGVDCGCKKRQEALNKLVPYKDKE